MTTKYQQRILLAIQFIEKNLNQPLNLKLVAEHCYFSPFHFHRVFSGIMHETLNDFIARRKLEIAISLLVIKPKMSITDIALSSGFSSSANFAKAVKLYFGYTPSEIRSPKAHHQGKVGKIVSKYGKSFDPASLYPYKVENSTDNNAMNSQAVEANNLEVVIKKLPAQAIVKLVSNGGYQADALFNTWDKLSQWGESIGIGKASQDRIALCYDNPAVTPVEKCRYEASIAVNDESEIPHPFIKAILPAGTYATIYVKGSSGDIAKAQMGLFSHWLPNSHYEPDNFPMLERYLNDVRIDGFVELEIMFKLKALK
jgi:AraC family transcriptional regulator